MLNADNLTDEIIAAQQTNADLMALFPAPTATYPTPGSRLVPYYMEDPGGVNFEQRIQQQPKDTMVISHVGTRTGRFANLEATKHDFRALVRVTGRVNPYWVAFVDGQCNWNGQTSRFRFLTIDPKVNPPEDLVMSQISFLIGDRFMVYDAVQFTFTLTERGVDN